MRIHSVALSVSAMIQMAGGIQIQVVNHSNNPENPLGLCEGDCDSDDHCGEGLYCFQRGSNERVPLPCEGGEADNSRTDYCVPGTFPTPSAPSPTNQRPVPIGRTPTNVAPVAIMQPVPFPALVSFGSSPPASMLPLGRCQGDCDSDRECAPGLTCFQRDSNSPVPGCVGGSSDSSYTDYCVPKAGYPRNPFFAPTPSPPPTSSPSATTMEPSTASDATGTPTESPTLSPSSTTTPPTEETDTPNVSPTQSPSAVTTQPSEETDEPTISPIQSPSAITARPSEETGAPTASPTQSPSIVTTQPTEETETPTVSPSVSVPTSLPLLISFGGNPPPFRLPLQLCQGDCDEDDDCEVGLYCFQRGSNEPVPHCAGGEFDSSRTDYCVPRTVPSPVASLPTSVPPVEGPTTPPAPVGPPTVAPLPFLVSFGGNPPPSVLPLSLCEGDCDSDNDCKPGLICYQKDSFAEVPGCIGGLMDESEEDYCVQPATPAVVTYTPGKLTVQKLGLLLSEGLDARIVATAGQPVRYHDGRESLEPFHLNPDAGATFPDEREGNEGGWIYVSNSEVNDAQGGVGAITFDKDGNIVDYKMLLKRSSMNCGGGRTPFGTWVSCEEVDAEGQLYQVDPTGQRAPQVLTLGKDGGRFESFAYDVRNRMFPRFFVTEDHEQGCLRRFTPSNPDWEDPWSMLHGDGKVDYLFLNPSASEEFGTYEWTDDLSRARSNAEKYYRFTEGIDVSDSELFFVCKESKHMFILDLDRGTYTRKSTVQGLFDGTPDQIERVLEGSSEFLYFTEEGGRDAGVHARNSDGNFFTIFESPVYEDETTGLSWSPDGRVMYVAYQFTGYLYSVWRRDGEPFHQTQLDVKFHHQP